MLQDSEDGVPMLLTIVCHSMMLMPVGMLVLCLLGYCLIVPMDLANYLGLGVLRDSQYWGIDINC